MSNVRKFFRASKGLEAIQVILIVAIACTILGQVLSQGESGVKSMGSMMGGLLGGGGAGAGAGGK